MSINKVDVGYQEINKTKYLNFTFVGHLDEAIASQTILRWNEEMDKIKSSGTKIPVIYNCDKMTGFDTSARKAWQDTMKLHKPHINVIWIICDNFFILSAAKTMGILAGFRIKTARSSSEINV